MPYPTSQGRLSIANRPLVRLPCCSHAFLVTVSKSPSATGTYSPVAGWGAKEIKLSLALATRAAVKADASRHLVWTTTAPTAFEIDTKIVDTSSGFYKVDVSIKYDDLWESAPFSLPGTLLSPNPTEIKTETVANTATLGPGLYPSGAPGLLATFTALGVALDTGATL
jgi:hypothetical protein